MSYSDIINIVSNSASSIFNEKIDGQRIHESIKSANITSVNTMPPNNLANRQNFTQNVWAKNFAMDLSRSKQHNKRIWFYFRLEKT